MRAMAYGTFLRTALCACLPGSTGIVRRPAHLTSLQNQETLRQAQGRLFTHEQGPSLGPAMGHPALGRARVMPGRLWFKACGLTGSVDFSIVQSKIAYSAKVRKRVNPMPKEVSEIATKAHEISASSLRASEASTKSRAVSTRMFNESIHRISNTRERLARGAVEIERFRTLGCSTVSQEAYRRSRSAVSARLAIKGAFRTNDQPSQEAEAIEGGASPSQAAVSL